MDGTFNVIKSSYYSPRRSVCFCQGYDGETTPGLVKLTIDTLPCKCLKSYLELTKIKIKTDAKGSKSHIKINPLRVCPFFYDPCILPTIVMPLILDLSQQFCESSQYHSQFTGMNPSVV
jgi:hypothetical protein